jgi:hypothetical protein
MAPGRPKSLGNCVARSVRRIRGPSRGGKIPVGFGARRRCPRAHHFDGLLCAKKNLDQEGAM